MRRPSIGLSLFLALAFAGAWVALVDADTRHVVAPLAASIVLAVGVWRVLWQRDHRMPLLDAGAIFAFVMLAYTAVPLAGYLAGGLAFTVLSDSRLLPYEMTAAELGAFSWRYIVYFGAFAVGYLLVRRSDRGPVVRVHRPDSATTIGLWVWALLALAYLALLWAVTGFTFLSSYEDRLGDLQLYASLPLAVQQVSHNVFGILQILKFGLLIVLYLNWPRTRWIVFAWVAIEVAITIAAFGQRTPLVLFLIANVLLYHRLVRPLSFSKAVIASVSITAGALVYGFVRSYFGTDIDDVPIFSATNEFQSLFATGYDVAQRYFNGELNPPWQVYAADIVRLFPQQILPFPKIEPSEWYLRELGIDGRGVAFMFGAIAENIISGDWPAFVVRGVLLGVILASVHNWYVRNKASFYVTLTYLWLCLTVYYCMRASMLYLTVWLVYRLLPTLLLIYVSGKVLHYATLETRQRRGHAGA